MELDEAAVALERVAAHHAGLCLLVVHGSRSRHQAHPGSDWDLGYVAADRVDPAALHADAARVLGTDDVDVVDLARVGAAALLRRRPRAMCVRSRPRRPRGVRARRHLVLV
jgi:predicted nucleotidyltransferase